MRPKALIGPDESLAEVPPRLKKRGKVIKFWANLGPVRISTGNSVRKIANFGFGPVTLTLISDLGYMNPNYTLQIGNGLTQDYSSDEAKALLHLTLSRGDGQALFRQRAQGSVACSQWGGWADSYRNLADHPITGVFLSTYGVVTGWIFRCDNEESDVRVFLQKRMVQVLRKQIAAMPDCKSAASLPVLPPEPEP